MTLKSIMCRFKFGSLALLLCACADTTGPVDPCVQADTLALLNVAGDSVSTVSTCIQLVTNRLP